MESLNAWAPRVLSLLRIVVALLFIENGTVKLFHFPVGEPGAPAALPTIELIAGWLEFGGGTLLALGVWTRPVAFILSGEMAVAYFMDHFPQSFWPIVNQGDNAILYCWVFFFLVFAGPGAWSLDAVLRRKV
jgi:putative oxidoreductase